MRRFAHRIVVATAAFSAVVATPAIVLAQQTAPSITPYVGYLVAGDWYKGPIGTSLSSSNAPMLGAQANIPLMRGVALVGTVAYASADLRVGLPVIGGVNIGTTNTLMYDGGIEIGGVASNVGIAPFLSAGVGGMNTDIKNRLFNTQESHIVYTAGIGVDVGLSRALSLRVQAKDWMGRFDSRDAIGFSTKANFAHNLALTAGVKLAF